MLEHCDEESDVLLKGCTSCGMSKKDKSTYWMLRWCVGLLNDMSKEWQCAERMNDLSKDSHDILKVVIDLKPYLKIIWVKIRLQLDHICSMKG